ncbi:putative D-xylose utilization operon transcriptional repressor [Methylobacterium crusticola]|uniref:D-xylose utilization operon transcriptional repressor n=1 Tax=Methylobacterium crusticola TaxID=1697972 RepID=A0ABQ4R7E9_9HYPH|nr:GntR family transcriptional regulator [Methylobacterium crusticola]GJD53159.1 putative D-xylose utilization operon transcriptional repressor [Methylobacterium crusticola]
MTALFPIATTSLAEEAFSKLVQAITSGEFAPGERLSEAELARQLGISRGPLREALGRLEGRLVVRTPRIGVRVVAFDRGTLEHLFLVREALEGMAARLAAEHMTADELREVGDLLDRHAGQPDLAAGRSYVQGSPDEDFHFAIVRSARNPRLQQLLLDEVYYQLRLQRLRSSTRPGRAQAALAEHREILAALRSRDPERAEGTMRRHIRSARLSALTELASPAGP